MYPYRPHPRNQASSEKCCMSKVHTQNAMRNSWQQPNLVSKKNELPEQVVFLH